MAGICPSHLRYVVTARISRCLHPDDLPTCSAHYTHTHRRVRRSRQRILILKRLRIHARFRVGNSRDDLTLRRAEVVDQGVVSHAVGVELPESDGMAVETPFKTVAD